MILPIILSYNFLNNKNKKYDGLWIFYKFLDFVNKNDGYIIGREVYFEKTETFKDYWDLRDDVLRMYDYTLPNKNILEKNSNFLISNKVEEHFIKNNIKLEDLLLKNDIILENEILKSLDKIKKESKKNIDIIITWYPLYTLKKISEELGIKLITMELTTIRKEWYNYTLGTMSLKNKYQAMSDIKKIKEINFDDKLVLTREELILLFSYTNDIEFNLKLLKTKPEYEIGYAIGLNNDPYENAFSTYSQDKIIKKLYENYNSENILLRNHPHTSKKENKGYNYDKSQSAREFISKCDKIVINLSNIGFESYLYGRKVTNLCGSFLSSLGEENNLNRLNDSTISLEILNSIIFCLYTPFQRMFDINYIKTFANNEKNINDIYIENQRKIFEDLKINYDFMINNNYKKRKNYLLKNLHKLESDRINRIEKISYNRAEKDYLDKQKKYITQLETEIVKKENYISTKEEEFEENINNCTKIINEQIIENKELKQELEEEKNMMHALRTLYEEEKIKSNDKDNIIIYLKEEQEKIINSKSWIITQPLRNVTEIIKRRRKK